MANGSGRLRSAGLRPEPEEVSALRAAVAIARFTPGPWEARGGSLHRQHWLIDAPGRRFIATIDGPPDKEGEANANLIATAPKLYSDLEHAVAFLRAAPLESGVCCCGNPVEGHTEGDGHSPVDELQYHAGGLADQFAETLAKARADTPNVSGLSHTGVDRG